MIQTQKEPLLQSLILTLSEVSKRLVRTEAKVTQLMLHVGMKTDGRQALVRHLTSAPGAVDG